ncbi:MAG TPA: uracil-DNA glycosylase [Candidatus Eremiobacteraceae bacterium]|nr:uracil-DNA glycosylase [Candidatus Eremiobacteraceae bacterium]
MALERQALDALRERVVACRRCPELRAYCREIGRAGKREFAGDTYWSKPVPGIGPASARLLIVGLAPAAHGANRTGRMFTGDSSGAWLSRALHRSGFATVPHSIRRGDGFAPIDAYITAALRCAPPGNKPTAIQLGRCAPYLRSEIELLHRLRVVVGLGKIGFDNVVRALESCGYVHADARPVFAHGATSTMSASDGRAVTLIASYHPSRQNTNTGVLTEPMLDAIFREARVALGPARR